MKGLAHTHIATRDVAMYATFGTVLVLYYLLATLLVAIYMHPKMFIVISYMHVLVLTL